jgi:DNA-binding beta-propeller fold protein YncE
MCRALGRYSKGASIDGESEALMERSQGNGLSRPARRARNLVTLFLITVLLVLAFTGLAWADAWTDISDATWQGVYRVSAADAFMLADGYPDGTFRPDRAVTSGQLAKMVADGLRIPPADPATPSFSDVPRGSIFYQYVEGAAAAGIISGYADGTFRPDENILREQTNSILGLWLSQEEISVLGSLQGAHGYYASLVDWYAAEGEDVLEDFADQDRVALVHRPATAYLIMRGVVLGLSSGDDTYLNPDSELTRAQAVAMILRTKAKQIAPNPATGLLLNGRQLNPQGELVTLGNFPTGGAVTADGRFLWTVSTGQGYNDIRIVDTASKRVVQTIPMAGASGGIALDSARQLAYVSGVTYSRWQPSRITLPGAAGNCVLVYKWAVADGQAAFLRVIPVPPPPGAPMVQAFPAANYPDAWPQELAVSPDGGRLLVPLNLADSAAVIDLNNADQVRYVPMGSGSYPFAAAVLPDGRTGLVSNEATGTLSVVDLQRAVKLRDITVGPPLSHPLGVVVDRAGARAYVALSSLDEVVVVDLHSWSVECTISVGRSAGLGTMPVAVALSPDESRLFVAESGVDAIAVIRLPSAQTTSALEWTLVGDIPVAEDPQVVLTAPSNGDDGAQLMYVAARGLGVGSNPSGPVPTNPSDPIFWAFNSAFAPTTDVFGPNSGTTYLPAMVTGRAGLMPLPSDDLVKQLTPAALRQIQPVGAQAAPAGTPLRAGGPIEHVFFVVRENRSYDQLLGDVSRGNGNPQLTIFGQNVTPNLHSLVTRFPLLDSVFANSEASIQGHFWTAAAIVPDYVDRNWVHEYAGRGRPNDFGVFAVTFPGNGFLFDQAERQGISYFNYGEAIAGVTPNIADRNQSPALRAEEMRVAANSDLGPTLTPNGTFPSDLTIGTALDGGQIFDSSLPAGAPAGSYSHIDSFRARFNSQLATGTVPALNYICLTCDHTRGTQPGYPIPTAMVADSDLAIGQLVEMISHSSIWSSSAIFIVEDDSQDGADHVDAHRIPVAVVSPYARQGAVIHTRYDLLSVVRSIELIIGMNPLSLNDALATPMYDVFTSEPLNASPVDAIPANIDLLTYNTPAAPWVALSAGLPLDKIDAVPQRVLDAILWKTVHGLDSTPPPPGPNAEYEE